jgi:hypothetical protein
MAWIPRHRAVQHEPCTRGPSTGGSSCAYPGSGGEKARRWWEEEEMRSRAREREGVWRGLFIKCGVVFSRSGTGLDSTCQSLRRRYRGWWDPWDTSSCGSSIFHPISFLLFLLLFSYLSWVVDLIYRVFSLYFSFVVDIISHGFRTGTSRQSCTRNAKIMTWI